MSSVTAPQTDHSVHKHEVHGLTVVQRVFILAAAVAVVAVSVFSLLALGTAQAVGIGVVLGALTLITVGEFLRVRMVKLSQLKTYTHSEWALFPSGLFSHANIVRRPRAAHHHTEHETEVPPKITVDGSASPTTLSPATHKHHRTTTKKKNSTETL